MEDEMIADLKAKVFPCHDIRMLMAHGAKRQEIRLF